MRPKLPRSTPAPTMHDSVVDQFVTTLGARWPQRTSRADLNWRFAVVNSPEVNAFASREDSST